MRHAYFVNLNKQKKTEEEEKKADKKNKKKNQPEDAQLNIVMDYIPSNVYRVQKHF